MKHPAGDTRRRFLQRGELLLLATMLSVGASASASDPSHHLLDGGETAKVRGNGASASSVERRTLMDAECNGHGTLDHHNGGGYCSCEPGYLPPGTRARQVGQDTDWMTHEGKGCNPKHYRHVDGLQDGSSEHLCAEACLHEPGCKYATYTFHDGGFGCHLTHAHEECSFYDHGGERVYEMNNNPCAYSDATTCSGHGAAQSDGSCACEEGFSHHDCSHEDSSDEEGSSSDEEGGCELKHRDSGLAGVITGVVIGAVMLLCNVCIPCFCCACCGRKIDKTKPQGMLGKLIVLALLGMTCVGCFTLIGATTGSYATVSATSSVDGCRAGLADTDDQSVYASFNFHISMDIEDLETADGTKTGQDAALTMLNKNRFVDPVPFHPIWEKAMNEWTKDHRGNKCALYNDVIPMDKDKCRSEDDWEQCPTKFIGWGPNAAGGTYRELSESSASPPKTNEVWSSDGIGGSLKAGFAAARRLHSKIESLTSSPPMRATEEETESASGNANPTSAKNDEKLDSRRLQDHNRQQDGREYAPSANYRQFPKISDSDVCKPPREDWAREAEEDTEEKWTDEDWGELLDDFFRGVAEVAVQARLWAYVVTCVENLDYGPVLEQDGNHHTLHFDRAATTGAALLAAEWPDQVGYCTGHQFSNEYTELQYRGNPFTDGGQDSDPKCANMLMTEYVHKMSALAAGLLTPAWLLMAPFFALVTNIIATLIPGNYGKCSRFCNLCGSFIVSLFFVIFMAWYQGAKNAIAMGNACNGLFEEVNKAKIADEELFGKIGETHLEEQADSLVYLGSYFTAGFFGYFLVLLSTALLTCLGSGGLLGGKFGSKSVVAGPPKIIVQQPGVVAPQTVLYQMPAQQVAAQAVPAQQVAAQAVPVQRVAAQAVPVQQVAAQAVPVQQVAAQAQ